MKGDVFPLTPQLTERQRQVFGLIRQRKSYREIAAELGVRLNAVRGHVKALQKKGYIASAEGKARAMEVLRPCTLPFIGVVKCGDPMRRRRAVSRRTSRARTGNHEKS